MKSGQTLILTSRDNYFFIYFSSKTETRDFVMSTISIQEARGNKRESLEKFSNHKRKKKNSILLNEEEACEGIINSVRRIEIYGNKNQVRAIRKMFVYGGGQLSDNK